MVLIVELFNHAILTIVEQSADMLFITQPTHEKVRTIGQRGQEATITL